LPTARLLDPVDELTLVVRLAKFDFQSEIGGPRRAARLDVGERVEPVDRRVAHPEHVEIRAV